VVLPDLLLGPGILVYVSLAIFQQSLLLFGVVLGVIDDPLGPLRSGRFQEIPALHLQAVIDELLELPGATDWQMALENHPVKAGEHPDDEAGKLGHERGYCRHGQPPLSEWLLVTGVLQR
jgi:hypothetical protein